ncbi:hypothetical protein EVAR_76056_1 [Eumeta japonica]|uniref:Uncharacterized protein n=1 Tax=Eumeta variegata TaxID=151549 RepID=A0A4C1W3X0_EUMVA|nr:hypothetical protein EVAR_76056_1 [Eumeta japonica]
MLTTRREWDDGQKRGQPELALTERNTTAEAVISCPQSVSVGNLPLEWARSCAAAKLATTGFNATLI